MFREVDRAFRLSGHGVARGEVLAPAKVNLTLKILGRRSDGYHVLDSQVAPIALFDRVRVQVSLQGKERSVSLACPSGGGVPQGASNLAARAARLYLDRAGAVGRVTISLDKQIPMGAGLGGGSSDAAATLRVLNVLAEPAVSERELAGWALQLGADVPLFLTGGTVRMRGIGEILESTSCPLGRSHGLVVVHPMVPLETRHVYAKYDDLLTSEGPVSRVRGLKVGRGPLLQWLENDLEAAAFRILPIVKDLKRQLRALGALGALMTGSGSAVFGVWDSVEEARVAAQAMRAAGLWARATWILDRLPAVETYHADGGRSPSW